VFIEVKDDGSGGDNWSYKTCKAPVKSPPPTNQHPVLLQAGCPSCHPANSVKALKGKYHIPWTCLPQAHFRGLPTSVISVMVFQFSVIVVIYQLQFQLQLCNSFIFQFQFQLQL